MNNFLRATVQNNSFYSKKYGLKSNLTIEDFEVLTRNEVQSLGKKLLSNNFTDINRLTHMTTSGSSGVPLTIYWDTNGYARSSLCLWRKRREYYNIFPDSKCLSFSLNLYNIDYDGKVKFAYERNKVLVNREFNKSDDNFYMIHEIILRFQPMWIFIQPYILKCYIIFCLRNNLKPSPCTKYIECSGEILTEDVRNKAKELFGAEVINLYGSEEMNGIAYECPFHHMHVIQNNVYVECMKQHNIGNEGEGLAVITNKNNMAMPLIRYLQGDIINLSQGSCNCGFIGTTIEYIGGRSREQIIINNINYNPYLLSQSIGIINNIFGFPITKFNFIYSQSTMTLSLSVVLQKQFLPWENTIKNELNMIFKKRHIYIDKVKIVEDLKDDNKKNTFLILKD